VTGIMGKRGEKNAAHYLGRQKDEHVKFSASIDNLKQKFERIDTVVDFEIILFLKGWFLDHIQGLDRLYVPFVKI